MYELGMSADGRKEPVFDALQAIENDVTPSVTNGEVYPSTAGDPFAMEDEGGTDAAAILMRSGIIVALLLTAFGGYKFYQGQNVKVQAAGEIRTDWAGRPLATNEHGDLVWPEQKDKAARKIDLTKTASVPKITKPKVVETKSVAVTDAPTKNAKYHIVEPGDTLSAISRAYKVSTAEIIEINAIADPRRIKPGMKLFVTR